MSRSGFRGPSAGLTIIPPSPDGYGSNARSRYAGIHDTGDQSPRRLLGMPPSPTHSTYSGVSGLSAVSGVSGSGVSGSGGSSAGVKGNRRRSFDAPWANFNGDRQPPPVPAKLPAMTDKRLPLPPGMTGVVVPPSPQRKAGPSLYDNKLMSSTLSQLPPIPPLSPNPTGTSALSNASHHITSSHIITPKPSFMSMTSLGGAYAVSMARPSLSGASHGGSSSMILLPDGTALPVGTGVSDAVGVGGRSVSETMAHSSPNSPWSLLTIHVLPLFAGSSLKTAIEDLNQLCLSHVMATSQRTSTSRLIAVLGSDLREFIASGMLTLKAKIESAEDAKLVARTAEIWSFFWTQVLPYIEGVFLPISQLRDVPSTSSGATSHQAISVRHLVLSGFMLHILLPLLPRLIASLRVALPASLTSGTEAERESAKTAQLADLRRLLQLSLVLSTQATYSSFFPSHAPDESERKNAEVRDSVEGLSRLVKWRIEAVEDAVAAAKARSLNASPGKTGGGPGQVAQSADSEIGAWPQRAQMRRHPSMLQRGPSMSQGTRHRRKGWRASVSSMQQAMALPESYHPTRQNSELLQQPEARWGRPRVDDDDDDDVPPGHSGLPSRQDSYAASAATATTVGVAGTASTATSTLTAGTARDTQALLSDEDQRTPQADFGRRAVRPDTQASSDALEADARRLNRAVA